MRLKALLKKIVEYILDGHRAAKGFVKFEAKENRSENLGE